MSTSSRLETVILRVFLSFLFLLALTTGLLMLIVGGISLPGVDSVPITVDNELRFYSAYWLAYGALALWANLKLTERLSYVPLLAGVLLLSGVGRLLSLILVGKPAAMFIPIMSFELLLPPIMYFLYWRLYQANQAQINQP